MFHINNSKLGISDTQQCQLYAACCNGDYKRALQLISNGADVDERGRNDETPLIVAARHGHAECVNLLLMNEAKVDMLNTFGESALLVASQGRFLEIVEQLLDNGAKATREVCKNVHHALDIHNFIDELPAACIRKLIDKLSFVSSSFANVSLRVFRQGRLELIKYLLAKESDEVIQHHYSFALYYAAYHNWAEVLCGLLDRGANINGLWQSETALSCACRQGNREIAELLLRRGANPYAHDELGKGLLPMQLACYTGDVHIFKLILQYSASFKALSSAVALLEQHHPLHIAYDSNCSEIVNLLLNIGVRVDYPDRLGVTILHKAVDAGSLDNAKLILDHGADLCSVNLYGILHKVFAECVRRNCPAVRDEFAADADHCSKIVEMINLLVNSGASCDVTDSNGETPLYVACAVQHATAVAALLAAGSNVNLTVNDRYPLMAACKAGDVRIVQMLLCAGAVVNTLALSEFNSPLRTTPLCVASMYGNYEIVAVLLRHGASANIYNDHNWTAIHYVIENLVGPSNSQNRYKKILKILLKEGADPNVCSGCDGETPLYKACLAGLVDVVRILLENNANPELVTFVGESPLYAACRSNNVDIAELLLAHGGTKINYVHVNDYLPLHAAVQKENECLVAVLLRYGVPVDATDSRGETALHLVTLGSIAELLLKHGAQRDLMDTFGETPLYTSCFYGRLDVIEVLLKYGANPNKHSLKMPLYIACQRNDVRAVKLLLTNCANPNIVPGRLTQVHKREVPYDFFDIADFSHDYKRLRTVKGYSGVQKEVHSASTIMPVTDFMPLLYMMCLVGNLPMIDLLLLHNADANITAPDGKTPLHCAVHHLSNPVDVPSSHVSETKSAELSNQLYYDNANFPTAPPSSTGHVCSTYEQQHGISSSFAKGNLLHKKLDYRYYSYPDVPVLNDVACLRHANAVHNIGAEITKKLLAAGAIVNWQDSAGQTALHQAVDAVCANPSCALGHQLVDVLLDGKANPNTLSRTTGDSPLHAACAAGVCELVSKLLQHGAIVEPDVGMRPLLRACEREHTDVVAMLLMRGADPNRRVAPLMATRCHISDSPLCIACRSGHANITSLLLQHGADVNALDNRSKSPVEYIVMNFSASGDGHDYQSTLAKLLEFGLDPNQCNVNGDTLLYWATQQKWPFAITSLLISHGADPNQSTSWRYSLAIACESNDKKLVEMLLMANANPNRLSFHDLPFNGQLPLCIAAKNQHPDIVEVLLSYGAAVNLHGTSGRAPLHYACCGHDHTIVDRLLEAGADPDQLTDTLGACPAEFTARLPLCLATCADSLAMVTTLLKHNANVNARDGYGRTALHYAVKNIAFGDDIPLGSSTLPSLLGISEMTESSSESDSSMASPALSTTEDDSSVEMETARDASAVVHRSSVVTVLLDSDADVNVVDGKGQTALYKATKKGLVNVICRMLSKTGADPNRTTSGRYPLCVACAYEQDFASMMVTILLKAGASPNVTAAEFGSGFWDEPISRMPLCIAAERGNYNMMLMLMENGADAGLCDLNGNNALNYVFQDVDFFDEECVLPCVLLLQNGADPNRACALQEVAPVYYLLDFVVADAGKTLMKEMIQRGLKLNDSPTTVGSFRYNSVFHLDDCICSSAHLDSIMFELFRAGAGRHMLSASCESEKNMDMLDDDPLDIRLSFAIVLDGYRASETDMRNLQAIELLDVVPKLADEFVKFLFWLTEDRKQAPSLMRQCRTTIRRQLQTAAVHRTIVPLVDQLPLPSQLRKYVNFDGPACEVDMTPAEQMQ